MFVSRKGSFSFNRSLCDRGSCLQGILQAKSSLDRSMNRCPSLHSLATARLLRKPPKRSSPRTDSSGERCLAVGEKSGQSESKKYLVGDENHHPSCFSKRASYIASFQVFHFLGYRLWFRSPTMDYLAPTKRQKLKVQYRAMAQERVPKNLNARAKKTKQKPVVPLVGHFRSLTHETH